MKHNKLTILVASTLLLSMALTGCGSKEETKQPSLEVDANIQTNVNNNQTDNKEVVSTPELNDSREKTETVILFDKLSYNINSNDIDVKLIRDDGKELNITLKEKDDYIYHDELPIGTYTVDNDKSTIQKMPQLYVGAKEKLKVISGEKAVVNIMVSTEKIIPYTEVEPFQYLNIEYSDISPYIRLSLNNTSDDFMLQKIEFSIENFDSRGYEIGEELTINARCDECRKNNILLIENKMTYTVENYNKFVFDYNELSSDEKTTIIEDATNIIKTVISSGGGMSGGQELDAYSRIYWKGSNYNLDEMVLDRIIFGVNNSGYKVSANYNNYMGLLLKLPNVDIRTDYFSNNTPLTSDVYVMVYVTNIIRKTDNTITYETKAIENMHRVYTSLEKFETLWNSDGGLGESQFTITTYVDN